MVLKFKRWRNQYIDLVGSKPDYIIDCPDSKLDNLQLEQLTRKQQQFKRILLEIGSGSGNHLIEVARAVPDTLCIGCELRFKRSYRAAVKAERERLGNLLILRLDARIIPSIFQHHSLDGIFINFPDPWAAKKRWTKHRLLKPDYLSQLCSLLKSNGFFSYKTDHLHCFEETNLCVSSRSELEITKFSHDLYRSSFLEGNFTSEFEQLFVSQGLPIYFLEARKLS